MTIQVSLNAAAGGLDRPLARLGKALRVAVRRLQHARMMSALAQLSDAQLAAMGIARGDITAHARRLVYGDG